MYHCGTDRDTAQHTLADCPAWAVQRRELVIVVGADLSLPVLVTRMTGSEEAWKTAVSFCEAVMLRKEAAERIRRQEAAAEEMAAAARAAAAGDRDSDSEESQGEEEEGKEETGESSTPTPPPSPPQIRRRSRRLRGVSPPQLGR